ncbi:YcaO-like family protein [Aquimarina agarivorans]|uniref:YcaO-like family protein n=1 Tax=Aquimarina agarivorans TaxID=980584 RepID=UPI000248F306|nr:YcaO-like family protein [Aquimarina agarivorans]
MDASLRKILDKVLDVDFGIIRFVKEAPLSSDEPEIFIAVTEFQNPFIISSSDREKYTMERKSAGAALDRETAIWSAVGEGLERYAGAIYDEDTVIWEKSSELVPEAYVHPDDFILFTKEQYATTDFKYNAHNPKIKVGWTSANSLNNHNEVLMPASLAYFAYKYEDKSEYLTDSYSTGLACGPTKEWAICGGLNEVIERDAYSLHWAARLSPKKIPLETAIKHSSPELKKLLEFDGVDLFIGDMTTDIGIPAIITIARQHGKPGIALGASSNVAPEKALEKAVIECFHTLNWCQEMRHRPTAIEETEVKQFADHVKYYLNEENEETASFLWSGNELSTLFEDDATSCVKNSGHKEQSEYMVNKLFEQGYASYLVDNTPNDIKELGLCVIKAIVPGLQPMWCGYNRVPLDRRRFESFLTYKGMDANTPINTNIHPFP